MQTFSDRLKAVREKRGYSQKELALKTGIGRSALSLYETQRREPDIATLVRLANGLNVTLDYLLGRDLSILARRIPLLGTIRAGAPILDQENITNYIEIPVDIKADFAVEVVGDSMSWVGIAERDIVICRLNQHPRSGQVVAVSLGEADWGATIKFYVEKEGRRWLCAANPAYEDIALDGKEYRIAGVAVKCLKEAPVFYDYQRLFAHYSRENREWSEMIIEARALGLAPQDILDYLKIVKRHKGV